MRINRYFSRLFKLLNLTFAAMLLWFCADIGKRETSADLSPADTLPTASSHAADTTQTEVQDPRTTVLQNEKPLSEKAPAEHRIAAGEYVVTGEVYEETLKQIKELVLELNSCIRTKNFSQWQTFLTSEYKAKFSDPAELNNLSDSPTLKKRNIVLRSLKDYFLNVVVPSRVRAGVDDIVFLTQDKIRVISTVQNQPVILYNMKKENNVWKVTSE